jgi:F-type H+-transporting ATPase subunit b
MLTLPFSMFFSFFCAFLATAATATTEAAAETAQAAHEAAHHAAPALGSWAYILQSNVINVAIVALFLGFMLSKLNLGKTINGKQQRVIDEIDSAEVRQKEAETKLDALSKRTNELEAEVQQIINEAKANAERLKTSILEDAETQAEKLRQNALKRLALEEKQRLAETQRRLMDEAVLATKALLENTLSQEDRIQSVEAFIDQLPQHVDALGGAK